MNCKVFSFPVATWLGWEYQFLRFFALTHNWEPHEFWEQEIAFMKEVLVIGHRNPDTDCICSAIAYAEFKRRTGLPEAVAARCGDTNDRIDFVLRSFGAAPPRFVADVSPTVRNVMQSAVISVPPKATVAEALSIMDERSIRVLPVLDQEDKCRGLISLFKMSKFFFPTPSRLYQSRLVLASLANLAKTLTAEVVHWENPDLEEDLMLMVGAMHLASFSERLAKYPQEKLLVIVGDRDDIQETAICAGVRAVVVTGGHGIDARLVEEAKKHRVSLLISPHDSATTAMLSRAAITVHHMVHERFLSFREDEPLIPAKQRATESNFQAFPVLDQHQRMVGILSKSDFLKKVERQLILVDHNELSQAVHGADQVQILEVVDHHRIGLTTHQPIRFVNEPVGSTSTIVADQFLRARIEMSEQIAGLLLAGIVSDTLNLTSPTTTGRDADILSILEVIACVTAREFTEKLFASGSILISKPADAAIRADCKEYVEGAVRFSVAQIEEIGFQQFWSRKTEVLDELESQRRDNGYLFSCVLITDVVQQTSLLLVAGPESFRRAIDYPEVEPGIYELEGIVSRKKQLLPYLTHLLKGVPSSVRQ